MNELDRLGARRRKLIAELEDLEPKLHGAMRDERAKRDANGKHLHTQREIMERSSYKTIQQVRVILGEIGQ